RSLCADARTLDRAAAVAALFAHRTGSARQQPRRVPLAGVHGEGDGEHPPGNGRKAAGDPEGPAPEKGKLAGGGRAGHGRRDGKRLAGVEGALAELDSASALLERKSLRGLGWRVEKPALQGVRLVFNSNGDERVE